MGLLDKNITITFLEGKVPLQDLFEVIKEKLGDKYKVEFIKKAMLPLSFWELPPQKTVSSWPKTLTTVLLLP